MLPVLVLAEVIAIEVPARVPAGAAPAEPPAPAEVDLRDRRAILGGYAQRGGFVLDFGARRRSRQQAAHRQRAGHNNKHSESIHGVLLVPFVRIFSPKDSSGASIAIVPVCGLNVAFTLLTLLWRRSSRA